MRPQRLPYGDVTAPPLGRTQRAVFTTGWRALSGARASLREARAGRCGPAGRGRRSEPRSSSRATRRPGSLGRDALGERVGVRRRAVGDDVDRRRGSGGRGCDLASDDRERGGEDDRPDQAAGAGRAAASAEDTTERSDAGVAADSVDTRWGSPRSTTWQRPSQAVGARAADVRRRGWSSARVVDLTRNLGTFQTQMA